MASSRERRRSGGLGPTTNVLTAIHVASNQVSRQFDNDVAQRAGLSLAEWRVILTLAHWEGASAMEITNLWGMEKMAISRAVHALEATGRLRRERDTRDKRRFNLYLTDDGRAIYRKNEPRATANYRAITAVLDKEEVRTLRRALGKLIDYTREAAGQEPG